MRCKPLLALTLVLASGVTALPTRGGEPPAVPTAADLAARERVRPKAEALLAWLRDPNRPEAEAARGFEKGVSGFVALGPAVVPFMIAELELPDAATFNIAAYVSGLVPAPGGVAALRNSIDVADEEGGAFAEARKEWAGYGLALLGDAEAVDLLARPKSDVAWVEFMEDTRLLEAVGVLTAPASVPRLLAQLERYSKDESLLPQMDFTLMALGRIGDSSAVSALVPLTQHPRVRTRGRAVQALGRIGTPAALDTVFSSLADPDSSVRIEAAIAVSNQAPADRTQAILAKLETETDAVIRGKLYYALACIGGDSIVEAFRSHWGRPDGLDRALLVVAVGRLGSRKALNILRDGLQDPDVNVAVQATRSLQAIGGEGAADTLIALLNDPRWPVAESAIEALTALGEKRAGPRVANRLLKVELAETIIRLELRTNVSKLCEALVALRYTAPIPDLEKAAAGQTEAGIVETLRATLRALETLDANKDDVAKWTQSAKSPDPALRGLAFERLGEIATPAATSALLRLHETADADGAIRILDALATARADKATPLLERILTGPEFDTAEMAQRRAFAAWCARRIGGDKMAALLRRAAERREGADYPVLLYLAELSGRAAVPILKSLRAPRLRHYDWSRGSEMEVLDAIVRDLEAGRSIARLDLSPEGAHAH